MQINEFKSTVMTFADPGSELLFDKSQVVISVNGDLITANITTRSGDVYVDEGSGPEPASKWILNRLARLPLLASRLRESVPQTRFFVSPSATLLPTLTTGPNEEVTQTDNALTMTLQTIGERSPLETMVLYIISDAGEGKTSLINEMAREQARLFMNNQSDWLLVPIPLGGRHFLRFDDITVGALQNRYRFPFLYYNSFIALVRMGVIVPAFDGFEEMLVESSSGEALSAMGILVGSLKSRGAMVVAARKAYFEFENLRTQEKLFDTIRTYSVGFGKVELARWKKEQFLAYCGKRGITNSEIIYNKASDRLSSNHPLLTRAVLVKSLIDIASSGPSLEALLEKLHTSGANFFSVFVRKLIEREAHEKWIDRSGENEVGTPILTVDEHCELLSQIALSMWESRVDHIKRDNLEFVSDYFSEVCRKNAYHVQQIRERIRGHAMLVTSKNAAYSVEFDHDEFRLYFLGEGIARHLQSLDNRSKAGVLGVFRRGVLPLQAQQALVHALVCDQSLDRLKIVRFLMDISCMDTQASYAHENSSRIIMHMLTNIDGEGMVVNNLAFGIDALRDRKLRNITFKDCYFSPTSLELTELEQCLFVNSRFTQLRLFNSSHIANVRFDSCTVDGISLVDKRREFWDPDAIQSRLLEIGVIYEEEEIVPHGPQIDTNELADDEIRDIEKIVRYFMRSTHISESIILMKLGTTRGPSFIEHSLPRCLLHGILEEISNQGSGTQRRFRLRVPLQKINTAIASCHGSFSSFIDMF